MIPPSSAWSDVNLGRSLPFGSATCMNRPSDNENAMGGQDNGFTM